MKSKMNRSKKRMKKRGKRKTTRTYGGDAKVEAEKSRKLAEEFKKKAEDAEKEAKEAEKKVKMIDERKITDININFYKSNFEKNNPFPYYEHVILNRSGQDVISDLYGVEELFPTFKGELEYLADPTKNEIFKPLKRKNIKIEHKKNDKSAPTLDFFNK